MQIARPTFACLRSAVAIALQVAVGPSVLAGGAAAQGEGRATQGTQVKAVIVAIAGGDLIAKDATQFIAVEAFLAPRMMQWRTSDGDVLAWTVSEDGKVTVQHRKEQRGTAEGTGQLGAGGLAAMAPLIAAPTLLDFHLPGVTEARVGADEVAGMQCDVYYAKVSDKGEYASLGAVQFKVWRRVEDRFALRFVASCEAGTLIWETLEITHNIQAPEGNTAK